MSDSPAIHPESGEVKRLVAGYFRTIRAILTAPVEFFRALPLRGGIGGPLAFALVTHWIAAALSFLVSQSFSFRTEELVRSYSRAVGQLFGSFSDDDIDRISRSAQYGSFKAALSNWIFGAGWVVLNPFVTLLWLLFTAALVYLGARIFVTPGDGSAQSSPREITFESAVRIVAYAGAPALLGFLPFVGGLVSTVGTMIFTVLAAREVYRIGTGRALVVGLFPKLLFIGMGFVALLAAIVAIIHWMSSF